MSQLHNVCAKIPENLYKDIREIMTNLNASIKENKKEIGLAEDKLTWDRVISEALNKWAENISQAETTQSKYDPFLKLAGLVKTRE